MSDDILNQPITDATTLGELKARVAARQAAAADARTGFRCPDITITGNDIEIDGVALFGTFGQWITEDINVERNVLGPDEPDFSIVTIHLFAEHVHLGERVTLDKNGDVQVDRS